MSFNSRTIPIPNSTSTSPTSNHYFASRNVPIPTRQQQSPLQSPTQLSRQQYSPPSSSHSTFVGTPIPNSSTSNSSKRTSLTSIPRSNYSYDTEDKRDISSSEGTNKSWSRRETQNDDEDEDDEMDLDEDNDSGEGGSGGGRDGGGKAARDRKRSRTLTTSHQTAVLNSLLNKTRFPSTETREEIGTQIGMSARRVQIWFQNRRQSQKRVKDRDGNELSPPGTAISLHDNYSSSSTHSREYNSSNNDSRFQHRPLVTHHPTSYDSYESRDNYNREAYNRHSLPNGVVMSPEEAHSRRLYSDSRGGGPRQEFNFNEYEARLAASASSRWSIESLPYPSSHYHSRSPSMPSPPLLPPIRSNSGASPSPPSTGVSASSTSSSATSSIREFGIKLPPISAMFGNGPSPLLQLVPLPSPQFHHAYTQYRQEREPLDSPSASFTSDRSSRGILSPDVSHYDEEDPFDRLPASHQQRRHDSTTTITQSPRDRNGFPSSNHSNQSRSQSREIELDLDLHSNSSSSAHDHSNSNSSNGGEGTRPRSSTSMESLPPTRQSSTSPATAFNRNIHLAPISSIRDDPTSTSYPNKQHTNSDRLPRLASLALYSPTEERFPAGIRNSSLFGNGGNYFDSPISAKSGPLGTTITTQSTTSVHTTTTTSSFSIPTSSTRSSIASNDNDASSKRCSTGATSLTSSIGDPIQDDNEKCGEIVDGGESLDKTSPRKLVF